MKKFFFAFALLAGLTLASCATDEATMPTPEVEQHLMELSLTTAMADYTRATDTAFEQGDQIGLYMLLPGENLLTIIHNQEAYLDNVALEVEEDGALRCVEDLNSDGVVDANDTLYWYADTECTADLVAYYPYNATSIYAESNGLFMNFRVKADQTTWAAYTASDLMMAYLQSAPTEESLTLPFQHKLSKVVVTVDNQLGEEIADLWFADVYGEVNYLVDSSCALETSGVKGMIRAYRETTRAEESFRLILAPQANVTPQLIVTTASEKQYTFNLEQAVTLLSGKQYTARITLDAESTSTDFTPEVTDWTEDEQFVFPVRESKWGVVGSFAASNGWNDDVVMMEIAEGIFSAEVEFAAGDEFKIRYDKNWAVNRGLSKAETLVVGLSYGVEQGGANCTIAADCSGLFEVRYDANKEQITLFAR